MIFLIQSPHAWRGVWQRPHHLAVRFARAGHAVRWVEPRYLAWLLRDRERFFRPRRERGSDGVEVIPVTLVNGERIPPVRRWNENRLGRALREEFPDRAGEKRILWLYNPHEAHLAGSVPHDLLVYDIMDEYRGFPWSPLHIEKEETGLLAQADWVFAGTHALLESKQEKAAGKIECELSGVESGHFSRVGAIAGIPDDLKPLRAKYKRLLGYAGMIDLRVDQELIAETARRHPDWGWILLGPLAADPARLRSQPNIHLLGQKSYDDLPRYYHAWDAALLPFVENELTRHINPTKMLEYAAAGLPIVARALPDVQRFYADGSFLYRTSGEFDSALRSILDGDAPTNQRPGVRSRLDLAAGWASDRSWDAIARRMLARVEALCEK